MYVEDGVVSRGIEVRVEDCAEGGGIEVCVEDGVVVVTAGAQVMRIFRIEMKS